MHLFIIKKVFLFRTKKCNLELSYREKLDSILYDRKFFFMHLWSDMVVGDSRCVDLIRSGLWNHWFDSRVHKSNTRLISTENDTFESVILADVKIASIRASVYASTVILWDCPINMTQHHTTQNTPNMIYNFDFYQLSLCKPWPCSTMV